MRVNSAAVNTKLPIFQVIADQIAEAGGEGKKISRLDIGNPLKDSRITETVCQGLIKLLKDKEKASILISRYPTNLDPSEFRTMVADHIKKIYGYTTSPDEISAVEGAHKGVFTALMAFNKPGESTVLIPVPGYPSYMAAVKALNLKQKAIPLYHGKINLTELGRMFEADKTIKSILLNYPQNPTGTVLSEPERTGLIKLCRKYQVAIVNDSPYGDLAFSEKPCKPFAADAKDVAIDIFSFSKAASIPGLSIGFVNSSKEKIDAFNKARYAISHSTSPLHIEAAKLVIPGFEDCIKRLRSRYENALKIAHEILGGFTDKVAKGAMYFWLKIPKWFRAESEDRTMDFTKHLINEARVATIPGSAFGDSDHVRLALAQKPAELRSALSRVREVVQAKS